MIFNKEKVWGNSYKGIGIKSDSRVHEKVMDLLKGLDLKNKTMLDIATGNGALAKRVKDFYPDIIIDVNDFEGQCSIDDVRKKFQVDLNKNYASEFSTYDIVLAVEILEHLENPWNFMREIKKILKPGGVLILSTPNTDSFLDRYIFLVSGHSFYFGEKGYYNSGGHIMPIPNWLFNMICEKTGFQKPELHSVDTSPHVGLKTSFFLSFIFPLYALFGENRNNRSINIFISKL